MKKLIVLFLALSSIFALNLNAQNTVTIGDVTALPGLVDIPIDVNFGVVTNTCSFDLTINYNTSQLTWVGIANVNGTLPSPAPTVSFPSVGQVKISWLSGSVGSAINGKLLDMQFTYAGGNSDLTFSAPAAGVVELGNCTGPSPIATTFNDGSITESALVPVSNWAIFLGIGLIVVFMAVGMRRYFFA
jgi:hypothetical protein